MVAPFACASRRHIHDGSQKSGAAQVHGSEVVPSTLTESGSRRWMARHTHDECSVDCGTRDGGVTISLLGDELRESPWRLWTLASVDHIAEEHDRQFHKALEVFVRRHVTDHARLTNAPAPASSPAKLHNDCLRNALVIQSKLVRLLTTHDQHADDNTGLEAHTRGDARFAHACLSCSCCSVRAFVKASMASYAALFFSDLACSESICL